MYTGEVAVEQEHLQKLLAAAKTLKVKGLFENTSSEPADNLDEDADKGAENQDAVSTQSLMEEKEKAVQRLEEKYYSLLLVKAVILIQFIFASLDFFRSVRPQYGTPWTRS